MALLLFDIDGTLLNTYGSGRDAANESFEKHFGHKNAFHNISLMGRTDLFIWKQVCQNFNIPINNFKKTKNNLLKDYYKYLQIKLFKNKKVKICPGIIEIIKKIKNKHQLGLITGNFKKSGLIKIAHFGLDKYFPVGGFGDDDENRNIIAKRAIKRAHHYYKKKYKQNEIFIIGDTQYDIQCAKTTGTVSVAVATGNNTVNDLKKFTPDHLFSSFSSPEKFL